MANPPPPYLACFNFMSIVFGILIFKIYILKAPPFSFICKFVNLIGKTNGLLNLYFFITN